MPTEQSDQVVTRGSSARQCDVLLVRERNKMHQARGASPLIDACTAADRDELQDDDVSRSFRDTENGNVGRQSGEARGLDDREIRPVAASAIALSGSVQITTRN
jgi:hypothetical protein